METQRLARHEAAHFVVAWAVDAPHFNVTIHPKHRKVDELGITLGFNAGDFSDVPFPVTLLSFLAGPVSDYWDLNENEMLKQFKRDIDDVYKVVDKEHSLSEIGSDCAAFLLHLGEAGINSQDLIDEILSEPKSRLSRPL